MIGSILGAAVRIATLPIVAADAAMDIACGGSGSKRERELTDSPLNGLANLGEEIAKACENIDETRG